MRTTLEDKTLSLEESSLNRDNSIKRAVNPYLLLVQVEVFTAVAATHGVVYVHERSQITGGKIAAQNIRQKTESKMSKRS